MPSPSTTTASSAPTAGWRRGASGSSWMRPYAERHGLTMLQLACAWNLAHPAVKCVAPTLIQESGPQAHGRSRRSAPSWPRSAAPARAPLRGAEVEAIRALGDNTGSMALKGASLEHEGPPRADRWRLDEELAAVAGALGDRPASATCSPAPGAERGGLECAPRGRDQPPCQLSVSRSHAYPCATEPRSRSSVSASSRSRPRTTAEVVTVRCWRATARSTRPPPTATRAASARPCRHGPGPRRGVHHHQVRQRRPRLRAGQARLPASLDRLESDYVDLYLIHWPVPAHDRYVETWKAFVELHAEGLIRSIGVSNFKPAHLERLIAETGVTPVRQPGRAAPLPPAGGAAPTSTRSTGSSPRPGARSRRAGARRPGDRARSRRRMRSRPARS